MRWETGSAKAVALGLEWFWENCRFSSAFFFQANIFWLVNNHEWGLSYRLQVSNPKNALKISLDFWDEGLWQQLGSRGKRSLLLFAGSSTRVVWDFACWDVKPSAFTVLEWGWLGQTRPVFRELSQLPNFQVYWKSHRGQEWRENASKFVCVKEAGLPGGFSIGDHQAAVLRALSSLACGSTKL